MIFVGIAIGVIATVIVGYVALVLWMNKHRNDFWA